MRKWLIVLLFPFFVWHPRRPRRPVVCRFDLDAGVPGATFFGVTTMALNVGVKLSLKIVNPTAAGVAVDLDKFPTALRDVAWTVDNPDLGAVVPSQPDGFAADYVGTAAGPVVITATGKNVKGEAVVKTLEVLNAVPIPVVDAFDIEAAPIE